MLARNEVYTIREDEVGNDPITTADRFFSQHMGIHKLLVVDKEDRLRGLYTLSDIERIMEESRDHVKPAVIPNSALCGAAVSVPANKTERLTGMTSCSYRRNGRARLDLVAVSTAHGHTKGWRRHQIHQGILSGFDNLPASVTSGEGVVPADAGLTRSKSAGPRLHMYDLEW